MVMSKEKKKKNKFLPAPAITQQVGEIDYRIGSRLNGERKARRLRLNSRKWPHLNLFCGLLNF